MMSQGKKTGTRLSITTSPCLEHRNDSSVSPTHTTQKESIKIAFIFEFDVCMRVPHAITFFAATQWHETSSTTMTTTTTDERVSVSCWVSNLINQIHCIEYKMNGLHKNTNKKQKGIWKCSKISMHHFGCIQCRGDDDDDNSHITYYFLFIFMRDSISVHHYSNNSFVVDAQASCSFMQRLKIIRSILGDSKQSTKAHLL